MLFLAIENRQERQKGRVRHFGDDSFSKEKEMMIKDLNLDITMN